MSEFIQRICPVCGDPKNQLIDGVDYTIRCWCDWARGFHERLERTVHPDFWGKEKTLLDWSPRMFKNGGKSAFANLIKYQKASAIFRLYDFCWKPLGASTALHRSVNYGRNLFIRGPAESGKGLLQACVKTFAAIKEISATPIPCEWFNLRSDLIESENFSKVGEMAKQRLYENYQAPQLMVVEGLKREGGIEERYGPRKFRGAGVLDDLLTRRMSRKGSMLFTSVDYIGTIGDSLGEKFNEIATSDKTDIIILLDVAHADAMLRGLQARYVALTDACSDLTGIPKSSSLAERVEGQNAVASVVNALYFFEAFKHIPDESGSTSASTFLRRLGLETKKPTVDKKIKQACQEFEADKAAQSLVYKENLQKARIMAVQECKEMSKKFSDAECLEVGRMMSIACGPVDELESEMRRAIALRSEIAGNKEVK